MKINKQVKQFGAIALGIVAILVTGDILLRVYQPKPELSRQIDTLTPEQEQAIETLNKLKQTAERVKKEAENAPNQANITLAQFEQLQKGMSYEEVKAILNAEGILDYSSDLGSSTTASYSFNIKGKPFASLIVIFYDDQLSSKSQYGLE